ncbi:MAG: 16S rRNA (cytosine(967)-C(5))-methyltransferase RsmB [Thermodesulfobacteriota bacterium]
MVSQAPYDQVRFLAWEILYQIEKEKAFADQILEEFLGSRKDLLPRDRAFIYELVLGTLRWQGKLDRHVNQAVRFPGKRIKLKLFVLLRLGAYQLLFLNKVPEAAAVNESVRLAKRIFRDDKIAQFVNATLRTIARNKSQPIAPSLDNDPLEHIAATFSHPRWLVARWIKEYGPEMTRDICAANNIPPPLALRINTLKTNRESLRGQLKNLGLDFRDTIFVPTGLILKKSPIILEENQLSKGDYYIQDEASQIVSSLLEVQPGMKVLDACAAPGGKTTHLAQLMKNQGQIIALDLSVPKTKILQKNCQRLGASIVQIICADSTCSLPFSPALFFDRILIDAPCSGLGTLHRHPDIKWHRRPDDINRLSFLQLTLLENLSGYLKKGGILIYSTCTMTREENDLVVERFRQRHKDFVLEDLRDFVSPSLKMMINGPGYLRTYPDFILPQGEYRLDGFFAARMRKNE